MLLYQEITEKSFKRSKCNCLKSMVEEVNHLCVLPESEKKKRHNYLRKVAELTQNHFITDDKPNVVGLILAGSANFKNELW